jgi:hypothetical protein
VWKLIVHKERLRNLMGNWLFLYLFHSFSIGFST